MTLYDVIIIGGGPAGLNAAVVLGRCQRQVLLLDAGKPRNASSHGIHNYLTADDILPSRFHNLARKEIRKYGVSFLNREVLNLRKDEAGLFEIRDNKGKTYRSKKLLIATGLRDRIPELEGIEKFYGKSIFHCPYCDAWEVRNKRLVVYAKNKNGAPLALSLRTWSPRVVLLTDGGRLRPKDEMMLRSMDIPVYREKIQKLWGQGRKLKKIHFNSGAFIECDAMFFVNGYDPQCDLVKQAGCDLSSLGAVITDRKQQTNIEGLYVAGDASKDMHFVVVAAAEGAKAGVTINKALQAEELMELR